MLCGRLKQIRERPDDAVWVDRAFRGQPRPEPVDPDAVHPDPLGAGHVTLQVVAHQTIVDRSDMLTWAALAAERELDLAPGTLAVPAGQNGSNGARPPRA